MDKEELIDKIVEESIPYANDFLEQHRKKGASEKDLLMFFDPDVRHPEVSTRIFVEEYLDEASKNYWYQRCKEEIEAKEYKYDGKCATEYSTSAHLNYAIMRLLCDETKKYVDKKANNIIENDRELRKHLDIQKKEQGDDFDLIDKVYVYIYDSIFIEPLRYIDAYEEPYKDAVIDWCKKNGHIIKEKYAEYDNAYIAHQR